MLKGNIPSDDSTELCHEKYIFRVCLSTQDPDQPAELHITDFAKQILIYHTFI